MKAKVNNSKFINWYFTDKDDYMTIAGEIVNQLLFDGSATTTTQELMDSCGYIPKHIVENNEECVLLQDADGEYQPCDCKLIF